MSTVQQLKTSPKTIAKIQALGKQVKVLQDQISAIIETVFDNSEHVDKDMKVIGFDNEHILFTFLDEKEKKE